jgi:hypothetical protein
MNSKSWPCRALASAEAASGQGKSRTNRRVASRIRRRIRLRTTALPIRRLTETPRRTCPISFGAVYRTSRECDQNRSRARTRSKSALARRRWTARMRREEASRPPSSAYGRANGGAAECCARPGCSSASESHARACAGCAWVGTYASSPRTVLLAPPRPPSTKAEDSRISGSVMVEEVYRRRRAAHKPSVSRETRWPATFPVNANRRLDVQ